MRRAVLVCVTLLATIGMMAGGRADEVQPGHVRLGDHRRFGRLVVTSVAAASITWSRDGDAIVLALSGGFQPVAPPSHPLPGIRSLVPAGDTLRVMVDHGSVTHVLRLAGRFVLDVGPGPARPAADAPDTTAIPSDPARMRGATMVLPGLPSPMVAVIDGPKVPSIKPTSPPADEPSSPATSASAGPLPPLAVPAEQDAANSGPISIAASLVPDGLLLPFEAGVGAAAFVQGGRLEIVFDSPRPIDLSGVTADPRFAQARLILLAAGTMLDLPCVDGCPVGLRRATGGWVVVPDAATAAGLETIQINGARSFPVQQPGHVVVIASPSSGMDVLVGTVRMAGQRVTTPRRSPGFNILPTLLGVAVERLADQVELRSDDREFLLTDPYQQRDAGPGGAAVFSRVLDLWSVGPAEQWRRYKTALADAASRAAGSRRTPRLDAARSALALGFGRETRRLSSIADADAPGGAEQAQSAFLSAAGGFLAGDADASRLLEDPRIGNSDEAVLWRNLAVARRDPTDRPAAAAIATRLGLLLHYPEALRRALAGDAAMALGRGGDDHARSLLTLLPGDRGRVGFARALAAGQGRQDVAALPLLDRLVDDPNPEVALAAFQEATATRLRAGMLNPGQAAILMDKHEFDARLAGQEEPFLVRMAALEQQAGDPGGALASLREALNQFPQNDRDIRAAAGTVLSALAGSARSAEAVGDGDKPSNPVDAVSLLETHQDLLPADFDRESLSIGLANRLAGLDLPDQAAQFLQRAAAQASGEKRGHLELALGRLQLQNGDAPAARAALDDAERSGLSPKLSDQRALLDAGISSANGDVPAALRASASLQDPEALAFRADLLGRTRDWQAQIPVLSALLAKTVPADAGRDDRLDTGAQALVLRLAAAMARAGQADALHTLDQRWGSAFPQGAGRDMLRLLASPGVNSVEDMSRTGNDLATTRSALTLLDQGGRSGLRGSM